MVKIPYICVHVPKKLYFDKEEIRICTILATSKKAAKEEAKLIELNHFIRDCYYPPRIYPPWETVWLRKPA